MISCKNSSFVEACFRSIDDARLVEDALVDKRELLNCCVATNLSRIELGCIGFPIKELIVFVLKFFVFLINLRVIAKNLITTSKLI